MTVNELKEELDNFLGDDEVVIRVNADEYQPRIKVQSRRLWVENGKKNVVVIKGYGSI